MFRFHPLFLSLIAAQGVTIPVTQTWSAELVAYDPQRNDGKVDALHVSDGSTQTLSGNQHFAAGSVGTQATSLGDLQNAGRIVDDQNLIGAARLDPGPQNYGITIPDSTTGGNTTYQVYNPASLVALTPVDATTTVEDIANVGDNQYIDARVGDVSNGTLNVSIGQPGAATTASSNGWTMAAKQSQLFNASGSGQLNWNSDNRITFNGVTTDPSQPRQLEVTNVATYKGAFSVTTLDGSSTAFNVTNASELQSYNNWLIKQLKSGNLSTRSYNSEFSKAFGRATGNISYRTSADDANDDVAQAIGDRVVLNADGGGAKATVNAGKTLEVVSANHGALRGSNGATVTVNGKVSSTGTSYTESAALDLLSGSKGTNNGVLNGGFLNKAGGSGVDASTLGYGSNVVNVLSDSTFTNNGVVNYASGGNETGRYTAALSLGNASAVNNGNINVGVRGSSANGTTSGVALRSAGSRFTNAAGGTIYLGRSPQNSLSDSATDVALNQSGTTSGISVTNGGSASNQGRIVIGSKVQNGAGMLANGGADTVLQNSGTIDVNGTAATVPRENTGMSVINAGSGGQIANSGTINLNGVNGTGIKVLATDGNRASASSSGTINVAGGADPSSGTRNFGLWVEGQDSGTASATVNGPVNLSGDGAIGVHARGNATVNVASNAVPGFSNGSQQIGFFAYGPDAHINVLDSSRFDVSTRDSTLFRLEQGADFDGSGLTLTTSGAGSTGVLGSGGNDTRINTAGARFDVSGEGARGVVVEGGASGTIDAATQLNLTGKNAIGAIADGQKHTLSGSRSAMPLASTRLTSDASITASQEGLTGLLARNRAQLSNSGDIRFSGADSTGLRVESGATASNSGTIAVSDGGTGIAVDGSSGSATTRATNGGTLAVNGGSDSAPTRGISASGTHALVQQNGTLSLNGEGATGAEALNGATVNAGSQSAVQFSNSNQTAYLADGSGSTLNSQAYLTGSGDAATGYDINNGATLNNQGDVNLSGSNNTGIRLRNASQLTNSGKITLANGTGLDVSGAGTSLSDGGTINVQDGTAGVRLSDGASLALNGDSTSITTGGSADAILLDSGTAGLTANNASLTVNGSGSGIENRAEIADVTLNNVTLNVADGSGIRSAIPFSQDSTLTTNVSGSGTGLNFTRADGSTTSNDLILGPGYTYNVTGAGGSAIRANTTGNVYSAANINITNPAGGSAIVTRTASHVVNTGNILSDSVSAPVIDLRGGSSVFENRGNIITPNPLTVAVAGGATSDSIALQDGEVVGDVSTGNGNDALAFTGGSLNGSLTMGNGADNQALVQSVNLDDARHITTNNGSGSVLTLSDVDASGGSLGDDDLSQGVNLGSGWGTINFASSDWVLTDNLKLSHSTINIDSGSTLQAGNGVNPVLEGATGDSLVVNNAGTFDLTNGSGSPGNTLTINGTLASQGGSLKLGTRLNAGGALSNQYSDTLRVNGDATGTTLIDVTPAAGSSGGLTDTDNNGVVSSNEGISLAQVSGDASASSFALKGGYLAAGPYQYRLYSFAPGSSSASQRLVSGTGDQFWDYRLANAYLCEDGPCNAVSSNGSGGGRLAVTPQVPAYISAPVGLSYYTMSVIDDLHKRLGELRHQQNMPAADGGEMFVRYTGSNMTYRSNVDFNHYGYDFDLDYSALQVGGNVVKLDGEHDRLRGGIAYTRGKSHIRPKAADGYSSTEFDSDSLALYGTWQRDNGFYLDGALSMDWHRGDTDVARQKAVTPLRAHGWSASLESGYPFEFANGVRLEPQAQLIYMQLKMNDFTDADQTRVHYDQHYDQTIGRLGARLDRSWQDESGRQYTPYVRANYYRGWGGIAKANIGSANSDASQSFSSGKFGQMWETGVGGTVTLKNNISLYGEADYRKEIDGNGAKGWGYNAGVRWTF